MNLFTISWKSKEIQVAKVIQRAKCPVLVLPLWEEGASSTNGKSKTPLLTLSLPPSSLEPQGDHFGSGKPR